MRFASLLLLGASACATVSPPLSGRRAAQAGTREGVVNHLSQTAASGELCDARLGGPLLADPSIRDGVIDAWVDGQVSEAVFSRCLQLSLATLPPRDATSMLDELAGVYERLLADDALERDEVKRKQLRTLHQGLLERPVGVETTVESVGPRLARLRALLERFGPVRQAFAREVLETAELEAGRWHGAPVDPTVLQGLFTDRAEAPLLRASRRLPVEPLRLEAGRLLIRLRLASSTWTGLDPQTVEDNVLRHGTNPIDLPHADIEEAWLQRSELWGSTVALTQPRGANFHELKAPGDQVLPTLHLRNVVWVIAKGFSQPLTVCEDGRPLDPTPCLPESSVSIESPVVMALGNARYEFHDEIPMALSNDLAAADRLRLPVHLDGEVMGWLDWKMRYVSGPSIEFAGGRSGQAGPAVAVRGREQLLSRRFIFEVRSGAALEHRVVEPDDLGRFQIISRGASGESGSPGTNGMSGGAGSECGSGGSGTDGGPGGPGGPGGDGGDITVSLTCVDLPCGAGALEKLQRTIRSLGGAGGPGGIGGSGGEGGAGGSGRPPSTRVDAQGNTVTDDPGCSAGSSGSPGSNGVNGPDGQPGAPGRVQFRDVSPMNQL